MRNRLILLALLGVLLAIPLQVAHAQETDGDDKLVLGESYVLRTNEELNGSLAIVGGQAVLEPNSMLKGDVVVLGGALTVGGTVRGSVAVFGGAVTLADGAVIGGDLASFGGAVERAPGAVISGDVFDAFSSWRGARGDTPAVPLPSAPTIPEVPRVSATERGPLWALGRVLEWELRTAAWALLIVLLGVAAVVLAPKAIGTIADGVANEPVLSFGVGLLTLVVAALGGGVLLIACGLGLLIWLATCLGVLAGWVAAGLWLGRRLLRGLKGHPTSALGEVALGVFLITLVGRLPWCLGFLFSLIVGSVGLGAVVLTRFGTQPAGGTGRHAAPPVPLPPVGGAAPVQPFIPVMESPESAESAPPSTGVASLVSAGLAPAAVEPSLSLTEPVEGETAAPEAEAAPPPSVPDVAGPEGVDRESAPALAEAADTELLAGGVEQETGPLSSDEFERIVGIGPVFAARLRNAGYARFSDLAGADAVALAVVTGASRERIEREDWIGQAFRLSGAG